MSGRGVTGLFRAALTEQRRALGAAIAGIAVPVVTLILIACADAISGARGEVLRVSLPTLLAVLLVAAPLGALAAPVVAARERGVLRLLRTKPVRPGALLVVYTPFGIASATLIVLVAGVAFAIARSIGSGNEGVRVEGSALWIALPAAVASAAGLCAVGVALAAVLASVARRASAVRAVATIAPAVVILAGGILPIDSFVPGLDMVLQYVPTTAMSRLMEEALGGGHANAMPAVVICLVSAGVWVVSVLRCRA